MKKWYSIESDMVNLEAHKLTAQNKAEAFREHDKLWNSFPRQRQKLTDSFYLVYMEEPKPDTANPDTEEARIIAIMDSLEKVRTDYRQKVRCY